MSSASSSNDFAAARQAMIDSQLRPQGVSNAAVIGAMATIERERFVPVEALSIAYADRPVPLGDGRSMSAPAALAQLLNALAPRPGERALTIGTNGYGAALLTAMGCTVTAVDSGESLKGSAKGAPFDLILIDGAVDSIPDSISGQLSEGGRLAAGLVQNRVTRLILGVKSGNCFGHRTIGDAAMPHLPGFARPVAFTF